MLDSLNNNALPQQGSRADHEPHDSRATDKPIDTSELFTRCMGNIDFAKSLLAELESSGPDRIEDIKRMAATADCEAAADAAHSLKGTAAILGAESLRRLAAEVETVGLAGIESQLNELASQLAEEMKRCLAFIPTINTINANNGNTSER